MISNHPRVVFQSKLSAGILIVVGSTLDLGELYVEVIVHTFQAANFIVVEESIVQNTPTAHVHLFTVITSTLSRSVPMPLLRSMRSCQSREALAL